MQVPDNLLPMGPPRAFISRDAIRRNIAQLRGAVGPRVRLCPAVKANAYGHGVGLILPVLREAAIDIVAVATLAEAAELRALHWSADILVFGRPVLGRTGRETRDLATEAVRLNIICTVGAFDEANALAEAAARLGRTARVQLKLDTGMGRAGLRAEAAAQLKRDIANLACVRLDGVYTHFAAADEPDLDFTRSQLAAFGEATAGMGAMPRHAANTAAIFRLPESHLDMVRPGVGLYGYWPDPLAAPPVPLCPCLRLVGRLASVKHLPAGHAVGYGRTFTTARDSVLGLVPVGYADGYARSLGNRAVMTVRADSGAPAAVPVVGRVSMDQTVVDLTDVPGIREGEPIVIIDDDAAAANSVMALARLMNTIPYEVTCALGRRLLRVAI